jgi:hypothetical protein
LDTDWELNQVHFFSENECKESALIVPVGRLSNSKKKRKQCERFVRQQTSRCDNWTNSHI